MDKYLQDEILERINDVYIDCPECSFIWDGQYQCCTCNGGPPHSKIHLKSFLDEHPNFFEDAKKVYEHDWAIEGSGGIYDTLFECEKCGEQFLESIDSNRSKPLTGCTN